MLAAVLLAAALAAGSAAQTIRPIVILVSIDGWRHDYLARFAPPDADQALRRPGFGLKALIPIFPSKTFPNHYTLVTGLYPERHGIVSNSMIDPNLPGRFTLRDRVVQQDTRWWGGEPLWITAQQQGQLAATMFWPGSDVEIDGHRPRYYRTFENELPNEQRVDQAAGVARPARGHAADIPDALLQHDGQRRPRRRSGFAGGRRGRGDGRSRDRTAREWRPRARAGIARELRLGQRSRDGRRSRPSGRS